MGIANDPGLAAPNRTGRTQVTIVPELGRRLLTVSRVIEVNASYRRIVLSGDDLAGGFPFVRFAPTDHVKLFFPNPQTGELVLPVIEDGRWSTPEGSPPPIFRDYTVRAWNPETNELTIDFVVHEHGVAGVWARDAVPGDEIGVLGPRGNILFPEGFPQYIAVGDETALPAIARLIEEAPASSLVTALIEIDDVSCEQVIASRAELDLRWVHRASHPVGDGHLSPLETAVRGLPVPSGPVFVFAAGEAGALKPIRRYFRRDLGLPKEQVDVDGYWKRGAENLDHHSSVLGDDD